MRYHSLLYFVHRYGTCGYIWVCYWHVYFFLFENSYKMCQKLWQKIDPAFCFCLFVHGARWIKIPGGRSPTDIEASVELQDPTSELETETIGDTSHAVFIALLKFFPVKGVGKPNRSMEQSSMLHQPLCTRNLLHCTQLVEWWMASTGTSCPSSLSFK